MKPLTITPTEEISFKSSLGIFVSIFGFIWLMIEPLDFFGMAPKISGLWGVYWIHSTIHNFVNWNDGLSNNK